MLVTWIAAPPTWRGLIVGGLLFRLFDQIKPWPARAAEKLPGGWGVMLDDVAAGAWGAAVVIGARALGWLVSLRSGGESGSAARAARRCGQRRRGVAMGALSAPAVARSSVAGRRSGTPRGVR